MGSPPDKWTPGEQDCSTRLLDVGRGQVDRQFSKLGDGEIGPVEQGDEFFLSWLAEDDAIGGELTLQALKCPDFPRIGQ